MRRHVLASIRHLPLSHLLLLLLLLLHFPLLLPLLQEKEAALLAEQEALKKTPTPELGPQLDKATFSQLVGSKTVLQSFASWVETDSKVKNTDADAYLRLFLDVNAYDTPDPNTDDIDAWKDDHAKGLSEKYFSRQSHKAIPVLQPVVKSLVGQRDRPRTAALRRAQELVVPHLEALFKTFWETRSDEVKRGFLNATSAGAHGDKRGKNIVGGMRIEEAGFIALPPYVKLVYS